MSKITKSEDALIATANRLLVEQGLSEVEVEQVIRTFEFELKERGIPFNGDAVMESVFKQNAETC
jgi:hypothetical protein